MTKEELIEKVARNLGAWDQVDHKSDRDYYEGMAKEAISTILTALQEPTEGMERAAFDEFEVTNPMQFKTGTHARNAIWGAMLNASPLAGEEARCGAKLNKAQRLEVRNKFSSRLIEFQKLGFAVSTSTDVDPQKLGDKYGHYFSVVVARGQRAWYFDTKQGMDDFIRDHEKQVFTPK